VTLAPVVDLSEARRRAASGKNMKAYIFWPLCVLITVGLFYGPWWLSVHTDMTTGEFLAGLLVVGTIATFVAGVFYERNKGG
jgi:polyferredoxin